MSSPCFIPEDPFTLFVGAEDSQNHTRARHPQHVLAFHLYIRRTRGFQLRVAAQRHRRELSFHRCCAARRQRARALVVSPRVRVALVLLLQQHCQVSLVSQFPTFTPLSPRLCSPGLRSMLFAFLSLVLSLCKHALICFFLAR